MDVDAGVAGGSALREFQRRHALREVRVRQRWGRLNGLVQALTNDPPTTRAWERGSVGESKLAAALGLIERDDVIVLNDRRVPRTRGNIDHIVVAPSGVYVVDAKRYIGEVRMRDVSGLFSRPTAGSSSAAATDRRALGRWPGRSTLFERRSVLRRISSSFLFSASLMPNGRCSARRPSLRASGSKVPARCES